MVARDPHRFVNELDATSVGRIMARLESRARDPVFTRLFEKYAEHLAVRQSARVLEVGCGTGATTRLLARRADFSGTAIGVDHGATFIEEARKLPRPKASTTESTSGSAMRTPWIFPMRLSMRRSRTP